MAYTFAASATGGSTGGGKTVATSSTLNIVAGDLIVAFAEWKIGASGGLTIAGATNSLTVGTELNEAGNLFLRSGVELIAVADAAETFTATLTNSQYDRSIIVLQFHATGTTTADQAEASGTGWDTAPITGNITTTGTDEVVASAILHDGAAYTTVEQIGDTAADGVVDITVDSNYRSAWYRILTGTAAGIHSQATLGATTDWLIDLLSFKATAAAGGTNVSKYKKYYDYRRAQ